MYECHCIAQTLNKHCTNKPFKPNISQEVSNVAYLLTRQHCYYATFSKSQNEHHTVLYYVYVMATFS